MADLRRLARWAREIGAGVLLVNPLSAVAPTVPQQASPYYPSSRRFRNPLYLNVEELPAADQCGGDMNKHIAAGHALNSEPLIDRNRVFQLKVDALNAIWRGDFSHDEFDLYCERQGESLTGFAVFCALAELRKEGDYRNWPAEFQRPDSAAVSQFAQQHTARVRFHKWLQWLLDEQLRRASQELPLVHDLPIGFDPGGADAWMWQDLLARGATVGAPPDQFNSQGQDWALPPFAPHKLQAARYEPFIETLRASMRHAGGLRIDHVMGLFRLYWIPQGFSPSEGAYVRYPADDLLGIVALESHRAGAWVAGEDLGTVEPEVRRRLFDERILTYRVALFEKDHPTNYPEQALAALTTHDLPTTAGLWSGADVQARRERGLSDEEQGWETIRAHLAAMSQLARDSSDADAIRALYEMLGRAPSAILVAALADALAVRQRTNMPGTINEWPNWCDTLPIMLDNIDSAQLPRQIAAALSR